jgi:hypothetical protein
MEAWMEEIGQGIASEYEDARLDALQEGITLTPEDWVDEQIYDYFKDTTVQWWGDLNEYKPEYFEEMELYLENNRPRIEVQSSRIYFNNEAIWNTEKGKLLYNYGYYKSAECRELWIAMI